MAAPRTGICRFSQPHVGPARYSDHDAFARWERSHLHEFTRAEGYRLGMLSDEDYHPEHVLDDRRVNLGGRGPEEQFAYVFDFE